MYIFIVILVVICIVVYCKPISNKSSHFWKYQPILRRGHEKVEVCGSMITEKKPDVIHKPGYIFKESSELLSHKEILRKLPGLDVNNYIHYSSIPDVRMFYLEKQGYPIAIIYAIPSLFDDKMIYYVSGLYVSPKFRNQQLASVCITNLINICWEDSKQFFFIHDDMRFDDDIMPYSTWDISSFIYHPWFSYLDNSIDDFTDLCELPKLDSSFCESFNTLHPNNKTLKIGDNVITYRVDKYWCYIIESSKMISHKDMEILYNHTNCLIYQSANVYIQKILPSLFKRTKKRILYIYNMKFNHSVGMERPLDSL